MNYHFDWVPIWAHRDLIVSGFVLTVAVSAAALVLAVVFGTCSARWRRRSRVCADRGGPVVEPTRNVPLLIHMYFWYIGLAFCGCRLFCAPYSGSPSILLPMSAKSCAAASMRWHAAKVQAALATGLTRAQSLRLVVYPQALRIIAPSLAGLFSQLIKDSSLASVITVAELSFAASAIESDTFRSFEVYITISAFYIVLVLAASNLVLLLPGAHRSDLTVRVADA